ncbi:YlxR family protein [bacterium]|nr:YlxR family protein [bacterium]
MTKESLRKCVGCNELKSRNELIKITVDNSSKEIFINPNSKTFGRSAYLCYNQNCIEQALKKRKINRALKIAANIDLKGLLNGQLKG